LDLRSAEGDVCEKMVKRPKVSCKAVRVTVYNSNDWLQFILTRVTSENRFPATTFEIEGEKRGILYLQNWQRICSVELTG
jgi:hypothetical protein